MIARLIENQENFSFSDELLQLEFVDDVSAFFWDYLYTKYLQNEPMSLAEILSKEDIPKEYLGAIAEHFTEEGGSLFKEILLRHADLVCDLRMTELIREMSNPSLSLEEKTNLLSELSLLKHEKNKRSLYLRTIQTQEV